MLAVSLTLAGVTLLAAIAATLAPELGPATAPHPTLHGTPDEALSIAAHNARTLIAPLLLIAGRWHTSRLTRPIGDAIVAALVIANATLVGLALGRYPTQLPAYLPHLPLEDTALAIAAGAWLAHRLADPADAPAPRLARAAVLTAAVTIARRDRRDLRRAAQGLTRGGGDHANTARAALRTHERTHAQTHDQWSWAGPGFCLQIHANAPGRLPDHPPSTLLGCGVVRQPAGVAEHQQAEPGAGRQQPSDNRGCHRREAENKEQQQQQRQDEDR